LQYLIKNIEQVQNSAVRFIAKLKGRDSITVARDKLNLETLDSQQTLQAEAQVTVATSI